MAAYREVPVITAADGVCTVSIVCSSTAQHRSLSTVRSNRQALTTPFPKVSTSGARVRHTPQVGAMVPHERLSA
jgi:hypothetical protein